MSTTRVEKTHCKSCMKKIDAHTSIEGHHKPQKGDFSICMYCGTISTFDEQLNLIAMSEEELQRLKEEDNKTYLLLKKAAVVIQSNIQKN